MLQAKLTTRCLKLVHSLYTEPVEEKLMGELIFNFVMTLPPLPGTSITPLEKRKRKKMEMEQIRAEIYVKCLQWHLENRRKTSIKEIVLLLSSSL